MINREKSNLEMLLSVYIRLKSGQCLPKLIQILLQLKKRKKTSPWHIIYDSVHAVIAGLCVLKGVKLKDMFLDLFLVLDTTFPKCATGHIEDQLNITLSLSDAKIVKLFSTTCTTQLMLR